MPAGVGLGTFPTNWNREAATRALTLELHPKAVFTLEGVLLAKLKNLYPKPSAFLFCFLDTIVFVKLMFSVLLFYLLTLFWGGGGGVL